MSHYFLQLTTTVAIISPLHNTSQDSQYNPEMYPPPNYPIYFSSQPFDSTSYGDASSMQHNGSDGQGKADGDNNIEEGLDRARQHSTHE